MNVIKASLARFVRDLLGVSDNMVRQGRVNFERGDNSSTLISVDTLGAALRLSQSDNFDSDAEQMRHQTVWRQPCVVDFYGPDGFSLAERYLNISGSQPGRELQRLHGLTVMRASAITDVASLQGTQNDERYQVETNVIATFSTQLPTRRVDDVGISVQDETGIAWDRRTGVLVVNGEPLITDDGNPLVVVTVHTGA